MIELAYLSALLERRHENHQSNRFKAIKTFFDSAVFVVPLESLFHAMANGTPEVVLQCCKIVSSSNTLGTLTDSSESLLAPMTSALARIRQFPTKRLKTKYIGRSKRSKRSRLSEFGDSVVDDDLAVGQASQSNTKLDEQNQLLIDTYSGIEQLVEKCKAAKRRRQHSPCEIDLGVIYPSADVKDTRKHNVKCCKTPMALLTEGRQELNRLGKELIDEQSGLKEERKPSNTNVKMLSVLTNLRKEFETCSTLLAAFMESQVQIPLEKAGGFAKHARSFGLSVWALLILPFQYLNRGFIRNLSEDIQKFVIEFSCNMPGIRKYVFSSEHQFPDYDERLEFLLRSMKKSVTCNQRYISYSLERQLQVQCKKRNILHNTPVDEILDQWNANFEEETLTLVPNEYRRLVARWIKWSLMINNLRESLASQTAVGVIGLVNSGKSKFVRSLFGKEVCK